MMAGRNREQMIEVARSGWQRWIDMDEEEGKPPSCTLIEYFDSTLDSFLQDEIDERTQEELASIQTDEDFMREWMGIFAIPSPEAS